MIRRFEPGRYLETSDDYAIFLDEFLRADDLTAFHSGLMTVIQAYGMSILAKKAGVDRAELYDPDMSFDTAAKVLKALNVNLTVTSHPEN